ncbi:Signal transduction histidine kinase [Draconibacterium orientale]|uniref:histidine kinase n=2 Tax=Draconibacterium orientale TaxID=1168034 RepID=X5DYJ2_9BACT|nr:hybrid sensor histidine kinase/response regulator transcription factor [Draconibacterium orientale]AHW59371.1 histidine kinase [Draconibacterium orientale]SEU14285.1 Signal transduction histidine kinase [Draconibacterium orientale]
MSTRYVLIFCLLISTTVFGQGIKFEHYSDEQGLSHNSVRHITQDNTGLLWLGTFDGLNSFDGNNFTVYQSKSKTRTSINNDDITALAFNRTTDQMWIGTRNGLTLHNLKTSQFKTFLPDDNNPQSLPDPEIRALYIDKFNRVWVGTKDQGLYIFDVTSNDFTKVEINGFNYIKSIYEDTDGSIWIGSNGRGGIAKITLNSAGTVVTIKSYKLLVPNSEEINPYVYFVFQDNKSDIFVGSREGLYKLDKTEDTFKLLPMVNATVRNLLGPYFISVAQAPNGKYWVGTLGGLLVCDHLEDISTGNYEWYYSVLSDQSALVDNSVSALYFDHSGVLWIGTENGLDKYDAYKNQFKSIKDISLFINDKVPRISGLAQTYDNKLIVSTHDNGLFLGENNKFSVLSTQFKKIASIYTYDGKTFYCGLWNGDILVLDYITRSFTSLDLGFGETPTFAFSRVANGDLFIGSHGNGAVLLNPEKMTYTPLLPDYFYDISTNQAICDTANNLWLATETSVICFNPETNKVKTYSNYLRLPEDSTAMFAKDIGIDNNGNIWVTTTEGLVYYAPLEDKFMLVATPGELREDWITDIRFAKNGEMWLNFNNNKIGSYNPFTKELNVYHINNGNRLDIFSNRGFLLLNDSVVYVPGKEGIIYFSTTIANDNSVSEPPFITEVKVQNKKVLPGDIINGQVILSEDINYAKEMTLKYANSNFSLSFSSPSYINVRLNKYQYMLEGFDEDWITSDNNSRNIQYTNLYPGTYIFKVKVQNSSGFWSDASAYTIHIDPPFWLTYKSIVLFILLISLILYIVHTQIRKSMLLKQELVLEKVKHEKDEKLNDEKLHFFTNISHELRTPISLILGPAKQLMEKGNITDYQKSRVELILNNSGRLLHLVNQLLDFRKAQTGELKLKVSDTDILQLTKNAFNSFKSFASEKNINFNLTTEHDQILGWIDRDKYDKVLYNLLSNAIKFTPKYGHVDLYVGMINDGSKQLHVEVSDNGIGIPPESVDKIFKRFYQAENSKTENTGSGIGLSLVESLLKIHKAAINVQSEQGKGSVFTVKIPIERKSYDEHEIFDVNTASYEDETQPKLPPKQVVQSTALKEKILVIEDNIELRKFIVDYLSDTYKVYEAEDGLKGLLLCRQKKPMLCISDIKMPVKNGFEFCMELKKDDLISHIPVILLTALSDNENQIKGYKLGADGYVAKPFDPVLLKIQIQNIIKSRLDLKAKFSGEVETKINILSHSQVDEVFINKLSCLIEENMHKPDLNIDFLCKEMGISSSKLYRKIKELTNLSPNEFVRTLRLKKSAQLLKSKEYNVSEVSDIVGFNDPLYFSRCFKKQFGFSPSTLL